MEVHTSNTQFTSFFSLFFNEFLAFYPALHTNSLSNCLNGIWWIFAKSLVKL